MGKLTRHIHVPLSDSLHAELRSAASRAGRPATEIARDAIDRWLAEEQRAALRAAIAQYAGAHAGTDVDLDRDLERATVEHLRSGAKPRKRLR